MKSAKNLLEAFSVFNEELVAKEINHNSDLNFSKIDEIITIWKKIENSENQTEDITLSVADIKTRVRTHRFAGRNWRGKMSTLANCLPQNEKEENDQY